MFKTSAHHQRAVSTCKNMFKHANGTLGVFIWLMVSTCKSIFKTSVHLQHMNAILDVVIWRLRAEIEHLF